MTSAHAYACAHEPARVDVELWMARPERRSDAAYAGDWSLLDATERERAERFHFDRDRRTFVVAHALVRRLLSHRTGVDPRSWRFDIGSHGRPEIARRDYRHLRFNLSHTDGMVACAITDHLDIGFDVEDARREAPLQVARHYFAPAEVSALQALSAGDQPARFFTYWTLKEAYIKACGLGLAIPLDQFVMDVAADPVRISFAPGWRDDPDAWSLRSFWLGDRHLGALAVRCARATLAVSIRECP